MRRIILATTMAAVLCGTALPVAAAGGPFAPVIYVNNAAVTQYELDQRVRFMQVLRAPGADAKSARQALIDDRLKMQAARQLGITVADDKLQEGLVEFAGRANLDVESFTKALAKAGVERQAYRDFVLSGVAWREVVRARIVPTVNVTDREVTQALKKEIETPIVSAVLLSELIIPAPPGQEQAALARAQRLVDQQPSEGAFAAAARQMSATPSAARGGRLEWTPLDRLPPTLKPVLLAMKPGQISQPLTVPGAVVLFFLRDTRGTLRPGAGDQTVEYLVMALPNAAEGARIAARARSCDDVHVEANRYSPDPVTRQTLPLGQVPADVAQRLATLDDGEASVLDYGAGARLVMLCKRMPALLAETAPIPGAAPAAPGTPPGTAAPAEAEADPMALTSREAMRETIFNRKINAAADAYLAELRADAILRQP